jgi:hypothetical protein
MKRKPLHVEPGTVLRQYSPDEVSQTVTRWLDAFGRDREDIGTEQYLWHIFSAERYPSESGVAAKLQYEQQRVHEYVVLSNDRRIAFTTDLRPERCSLTDYYVFPPNLAWTMAITHEDGWLGPYFARHQDFEKLDRENAARNRKEREAQTARLKGWR